jgi:ParB family chromosome partitioning protein
MKGQQVMMLPVDEVFPDLSQPRKSLQKEELDRMAASIAARGILQPLRVRWEEEPRGCWVIITGETRYRAARQAGLRCCPACRWKAS